MDSGARRAQIAKAGAAQRRTLAWAAVGLAVAVTVANLALIALNWHTGSPGMSGSFELGTALAYLGVAAVGAAMVARGSGRRVGWIFLASGLLLGASALASEYGTYGILTSPGSLPGARFVSWAGAWGWWAGAGLGLNFGLLLYPHGTLPSPRWRGLAGGVVAGFVLLVLLHALAPGPLHGEFAFVVNPFGVGDGALLRALRDNAWLLLTANTIVAVAALLARASRAGPDERHQLQWLCVPGVAAVVAAPLWGLSTGGEGDASPASQVLVLLAVLGTPVAVAAALGRAASLMRSLARVVVAREEERGRIRRDLHDGLGPTLAGVALQLDVARSLVRTDPASAETILDGLVGLVKRGIGDIRRLVDDLRPPGLEQLGLVSAIRESTSYLNARPGDEGLAVVVEAAGNLGHLPPATEVTAFRIVMEAVTNASRHAHASHCVVRLELDGALELRVEDDGCGLTPDHVPGVGLASMCERAAEVGGTCSVRARPGGGTLVLASLPVDGR